MQPPVLSEALHRHHFVSLRLHGEDEARTDEPPVEEHRAGTALALLAGILGARKPEPLAQCEQETLSFPDIRLARLAVDVERNPHARHRSRARLVRTRSAC